MVTDRCHTKHHTHVSCSDKNVLCCDAEAGIVNDSLESEERDSSDSGSGGDLLGLGYADESDDEAGSEEAHRRQVGCSTEHGKAHVTGCCIRY